MNKASELFLSYFFYPLLVTFATVIGSVLLSKISTGNWFTYFQQMTTLHWLVAIGILLILFAAILVFKIRAATQELNAFSGFGEIINPHITRREVSEYTFDGVLWPVIVLEYGPYVARRAPSPNDFESETPPRCPRCRTDLDETKAFWGYFVWVCPRGDFRKRSWKSYYVSKEAVQKILQANYRNYIRNQNP